MRRIGAADGLREGICVDAHQLERAKAAGNFGARAGERAFADQTSRVSESCCAIRICPARANAYGTSRAARGEGTDTLIRCTISESGGAKNVHQPKERGRANITWKRRHNRGGVILQLFVDRKKR